MDKQQQVVVSLVDAAASGGGDGLTTLVAANSAPAQQLLLQQQQNRDSEVKVIKTSMAPPVFTPRTTTTVGSVGDSMALKPHQAMPVLSSQLNSAPLLSFKPGGGVKVAVTTSSTPVAPVVKAENTTTDDEQKVW